MENITYVKYRRNSVPLILLVAVLFVFGITPTFADVSTHVSSKSNEVFGFDYEMGIATRVDGNELKHYWSPFLINISNTTNLIGAKNINPVNIELNPKMHYILIREYSFFPWLYRQRIVMVTE